MDRDVDASQQISSALILAAQGKHPQAGLQFARAIQADPNNFAIAYRYGFYLSRQVKYQKAESLLATAAMINPRNLDTYIEWGNAAFLNGDYDKSTEIYKRLFKIEPKMPKAHNNCGFILYSQEKLDEALEQFNEAVAIDVRENVAYFNSALVLFHQGKIKEGNEKLRQGIKATDSGGNYSLFVLQERYSIQVAHTEKKLKEEALTPEKRAFLQAKLNGIQRILDLLETSKKINDTLDEYAHVFYQNGDNNIKLTLQNEMSTNYSESLVHYLTAFFKKILLIREKDAIIYDKDLALKIVSICLKLVQPLEHKSKTPIMEVLPYLDQIFEAKSEQDFQREVTELLRISPKLKAEDDLLGFISKLAQKLTMLRKEDFAQEFEWDKFDKDKLTIIKELQSILGERDVWGKKEECCAFSDCVKVILLLFFEGIASERESLGLADEISVHIALYIESNK